MSQDFFRQYEEARKLVRSINEDFSTRDNLIRTEQNPVKVTQVLHRQLNQLSTQITNLLDSLSEKQGINNQDITRPELERRRKMIFELKNTLDTLNKRLNNKSSLIGGQSSYIPPSDSGYRAIRDSDTVSIETLREDKRAFEADFNHKVMELSDATNNLKRDQMGMGDELAYQNEHLLPNIEYQIDSNNMKLFKNNSKLDRILRKGSDCKLWLCIIIELVILILVIVN